MDLVTMRSSFRDAVSSLDGDLTDASIDGFLDRAWRFTLPSAVAGSYFDKSWTLTTAAGTQSYAFPAWVVSHHGFAWISTSGGSPVVYPIGVVTDPAQFEIQYAVPGISQRPTTVLLSGRTAKLYPTPDAVYGITIAVRGGSESAIDSTGVDDEIIAKCVIHAAAIDFLTNSADDADGAAKNQNLLEGWQDMLETRSMGSPTSRFFARSF